MLYRFVSIETFLDIILNQHLVFVHPSLWDDPYEEVLINSIWKNIDNENYVLLMLTYILSHNFYAQSWTSLDESDALWRIYSHNNTSIRVAVKEEKISQLENVEFKPVKYVKDIKDINIFYNDEHIYEELTKKRLAFKHEEEVRLFNHIKFSNDIEDMKIIVDDFRKMFDSRKINEMNLDTFQTEIHRIVNHYNLNLNKKVKSINYTHVDNFIDSVMLNPFAPDWFNETLSQLCKNYNINYLGKSNLYDTPNKE